jgi:hypothetical protein
MYNVSKLTKLNKLLTVCGGEAAFTRRYICIMYLN